MAEKRVDVYMRLYVSDWLEATADLSLEEQGAYLRLLAFMWKRDGWLVLDHHALARLMAVSRRNWDRLWSKLSRFFIVNEDVKTFTQKRLQEELASAHKWRLKCIEGGKASGAARRGKFEESSKGSSKGSSRLVEGEHLAVLSPPPISHSHIDPPIVPQGDDSDSSRDSAEEPYPPEFESAWREYPKTPPGRSVKADSYAAWKQKRPPLARFLENLAAWKRCREWTKDQGEYVPGMQKFIRKGFWQHPPGESNGMSDAAQAALDLSARIVAAEGT
jgi:uncharacterized protein YdaU (DUF1376 family)